MLWHAFLLVPIYFQSFFSVGEERAGLYVSRAFVR